MRDVLGTLFLSVLAGHRRYAPISSLRCDGVTLALLGMSKVVSEDAVRRALKAMDETAGSAWLERHLDACIGPLSGEPWILDVETTIKPPYGSQEGAELGYNPHKPGRRSHAYPTYMIGELRLALAVEVHSGKQYASRHAAPGLWSLLARLGWDRWPALLRGAIRWANAADMARAEHEGLPYLFELRTTRNVERLLERAMAEHDREPAGQGWQGPGAGKARGLARPGGWQGPGAGKARRRRCGWTVGAGPVGWCSCAVAWRANRPWRSARTASSACRSSRSSPRASASSTKSPSW